MNPEKEIVLRWLHSEGYFTITNLNAGQNRTIDIIAIKHTGTFIDSAKHVEVHCSFATSIVTNKEKTELAERFNNFAVEKRVRQAIKERLGEDVDYEKVLVSTSENLELKGIKIIKFEEVLLDVIHEIDTQNYRNDVLRTMQLLKYLLITRPKYATELLGERAKTTFKKRKKEEIIRKILTSESARSALMKKANEQILIDLLKQTPLINSEKVLKLLVDDVLSTRARNMLIRYLVKPEEKLVEEEKPERKEVSLSKFID